MLQVYVTESGVFDTENAIEIANSTHCLALGEFKSSLASNFVDPKRRVLTYFE